MKTEWKGGTLLSPVPAVMVTVGDMENANIITIGWTGIVCSEPPKTYVSIRPERYSHGILLEKKEFVINLVPAAMAEACDYCGMVTGRKVNKWEKCGLTKEVLQNTDVLIWWGHMRHNDVPDEVVNRVKESVLKGMGIICLHSAHHSRLFKSLMGTTCNLSWREDGDLERVWTVNPAHPIAQGIGRYFELNGVETYAEPFGIPEPDEVVFMGWYEGGEVFRTGCTFHRGNGRIFYFQPGHESNPTFHNEYVQRIIINAVRWANPVNPVREPIPCPHKKVPPEEKYREELAK
mgnify:CR=1 FL=1